MITLQFGVVKKKRNSTYVPTAEELPATQYAALKDGCSDHNPVFLLSNTNNVFAFNYVKWDNWYYFIDDVMRERNQLVSVHCSLDVLATYKAEILQTTCFVSYSSVSGGSWLPDTRIPIKNDVSVQSNTAALPFLSQQPWYYLTVIGDESGCTTWKLRRERLIRLINSLSVQNNAELRRIENLDYGTPEEAVESLTYALSSTALWSNAYANAPNCIRSCTWSLLDDGVIYGDESVEPIHLGDYDTEIMAVQSDTTPQTGSITISIPWQYSDWRRAQAEDVYLYLPFVGMISLTSENLVETSSLTINYSFTVLDGNICYQILAGSQVVGSYGGKASGEYPIGIIRGASAAELAQTLLAGVEKTVATAAHGSLLNPMGVAATAGQAVLTGIDVKSASLQKYPSCIGGIGGGAGLGLSKNIVCFSVAHGTSCTPQEMAAVMGAPTMKPLTLSSCTGYCECVNAHVALSASADAIAEVDRFINSGFFIE